MSDIFEEVDGGVRQDKLENWWKRYRWVVFGAIGLLIGAVAANEFILAPQAKAARAERSQALETAIKNLDNGNYAEAEAALVRLSEEKSKIAPLAANYLAQLKLEANGDAAAAQARLETIAGVEGGPYARLALLKTAYFKADTQSLSDLEATLGSLVEDPGPTGALARELIAAKAYASGDIARARTEFNRLRFDTAAPEGVKRRAELALAAIPVAPSSETASDPETETAPAPTSETPEEPGQ